MKDKKLVDFLSFNTAFGLRNLAVETKEKTMAIRTNDNRTYYINPAHLTFNENSGYGANLIQVSASSSCRISVYDPNSGIRYSDADKNFQRWKITAYNNKFPDNDAYRIYVRLERNGTSALIVYSKKVYNVDGSSADTEASADYYYIYIGDVSATDGTSIRSITYDTGYLESDQGLNDSNDFGEMWEFDKYSTPWLIRAKQWLASFTVKGFISLVGGLIFKKGEEEKAITDIKRSTDNDEDVPVSDDSVPTTKYITNIIEDLDERFLRKDQDDYTSHSLKVGGKLVSEGGLQIGESYVEGMTGVGGYLDPEANAYLKSLTLREFLEVPELRFNRVDVVSGELWNSIAFGVIEAVDTARMIATLHLVEGEQMNIHVNDICRGIFHNLSGNNLSETVDSCGFVQMSGFSTAYFTPIQLLEDGKRFRYELKGDTSVHPQPGMKFAVYGNFLDKSRQASAYSTRTYTRYLNNVDTWEINPDKHIYAQFGNLEGLVIGGQAMHGYGSFQHNSYFTGAHLQLTKEQEDLLKGDSAYSTQLSDYEGVVKVDSEGVVIGTFRETVNVVSKDANVVVTEESGEQSNVVASRFRLHTRIQAFRGPEELFASDGVKKGAFVASITPVGCSATLDNGLIYVESVDTSVPVHYVEVSVNCEGNATFNMTYTVTAVEVGQSPIRVDLDNEMSSFASDDKGNVLAFPSEGVEIKATMWHGNEKMFLSDAWVDAPNGITVDDVIVVNDLENHYAVLRITSVDSSASVSNSIHVYLKGKIDEYREIQYDGFATHTLNKVMMGENAVNYELRPSVSSIKIADDGSYSVSSLTCKVARMDGSGWKELTSSEMTSASLSMQRKLDSGSWGTYSYGSSINVSSNNYTKEIAFRLRFRDESGTYQILDVENIPIVSDGNSPVIADLTNEMATVAADENGAVIGIRSVSTTFRILGGNEILSLSSLSYSSDVDGFTVTADKSTGKVSVSVADYAPAKGSVTITGKATFQGKEETRSAVFAINKLNMGRDAVVYQLNPSDNAISADAAGNTNPDKIYAYLTKTKGDSPAESITTGMPEGYSIRYYLDGASTYAEIVNIRNGVSVAGIKKSIRFELWYGSILVDVETVPVAADGNGIMDVVVYYLLNEGKRPSENDAWGDPVPEGGNAPEPNANNRYLWKKTVTVFTDGSERVVIENVGVYGKDGRGITGYSEDYKITASSSVPGKNEGGWGNFRQPTTDEPYLWRRKTYSYSDGTSETSVELVTVRGENGTSVKIKGTLSSYGELISLYPNGTGDLSDGYLIDGYLYIYDGDSWENVGEIKGPQGDPGARAFVHIKYANEDPGGTAVSTNVGTRYISFTDINGDGKELGEDVGDYEGIYTDWTESDSLNISDYKWKYVRGEMGISPNTAYKSTVFKWVRIGSSPSQPGVGTVPGATNFGGTYANPVPYGWSDGVPNNPSTEENEYNLWATTRIFSSDGLSPQQSSWTTPQRMVDGSGFDVEYSSLENPSAPVGHPNTNAQWSSEASEDTIWMAQSRLVNGAWTDWQVSKIKGERGEDGTSIKIKGTLSSVDELPSKPADSSDCYVVGGELYVWDGDSWQNVGQFKGDPGASQYLHIKYANSLTVGDWTEPNGETPGRYIGTYVSEDSKDPIASDENWGLFKWAKWQGEDGFGYEYIYKLTEDPTAPSLPTQGVKYTEEEWQKDDFVPTADGWTDNPRDVSADFPYCWMCYRMKVDGIWGAYKGSATNTGYAALWAKFGKDGVDGKDGVTPAALFKSTVFKWAKGESVDAPASSQGSYDDPVPSGWSDGVPAKDASMDDTYRLWATSRWFSSDGKTESGQDASWSKPGVMSNNANFLVLFSALENPSAPSGHPNTNSQWTEEASKDTIWMATSTLNEGKWSDWQVSKIKGEKGADGTSIKIKGTLSSTSELPAQPADPSDCYIINGELYVWDGDSWQNVGKFKGDKGDSSFLHIKYANAGTSSDKDFTATIGGTTVYLKLTSSSGEQPGEFIGTFADEISTDPMPSDSARFSKYVWSYWKGQDGWGYEYIYKLTAKDTDDHKVPTTSENRDDYVPSGWTDNPSGVSESFPYEWMCYRIKKDRTWGKWIGSDADNSVAALWAKFGKDGVDGKDGVTPAALFKSTVFKWANGESVDAPASNQGSYDNPVPSGWSDGVPAKDASMDDTYRLWATSRWFSSDGKTESGQDASWSKPGVMSNNANFLVLFSALENPSAPSGHPNTNAQWTEEASKDTIWMATSTLNEGKWSDWQVSKIKGEKGADGTSIKIKGTLSSTSELPAQPADPSDCYIINGELYVWDGDSWHNVGKFKGDKGDSSFLHIKYANAGTSSDKDFTATIGGTTVYLKLTASSGEQPGEFIGTFADEISTDPMPSDSARFSKYVWSYWKGQDGWGYEYIYKLTAKDTDDHKVPTTSENRDDYVPSGWTDNPSGVSESFPYEWMCYRIKKDRTWGKWIGSDADNSVAALWAKFGKDGVDGKDGTDGVGAYTLDLTNQNESVPCDYNGNVLGTIAGTTAKVYCGGELQSGWTFTKADNGCTSSINASSGVVTVSSLSKDSATVIITAAKSGLSSMTVVYTISKVRGGENGEDAVVYALRPSVDVVQVDTNGNITPGSITCKVLKKIGAGDYTEASVGYLMYKRSSDSEEIAYNSAVSLTAAMSYIEFVLYKSSTDKTVLDRERVPVVKDGQKGTDGVGAFTLDLTNQNESVPCDHEGNVLGTIAGTTAKVYCGGELQSGWTFTKADNGCTSSINASSGVVTVSSLSKDSATVTITAAKSGLSSMTVVYTISKVRAGENGEDAVVYALRPSVDVVQVDTNGNITPGSITCKVLKKVGAGDYTEASVGYLMYKRSSDSAEIAYSSAVSLTAAMSYIDFVLYKSSTDKTVLDRERVPVVKDGQKGTDGVGAFTLDLTNQNESVPCDHEGNVLGTIAGTTAKVYCGGELQSGWTFTKVDNGCTSSINASSGVVTVSSLSKDSATVTITAAKNGFSSMSVVYTISKVRAGENGEDAVVYALRPSVDVVQVDTDGNITPGSITCKVLKKVGAGDYTEASVGYLMYKRSSDSAEIAYSSAVSLTAAMSYIEFVLYKSSTDKTVLDRERVPVVKDGSAGEEGEPTVRYDLVSPSDTFTINRSGYIYPSSVVVTCKKRIGLNPATNCADYYLLVWRWVVSTESWELVEDNEGVKSDRITVVPALSNRYGMYRVCAYETKPTSSSTPDSGTGEVEPKTINVIREAPQGEQGENGYFPRDCGIYEAGRTYYWRKEGNETYRDKVIYEIDGIYYNFIVASLNNEGGVSVPPTLGNGSEPGSSDGNWELMSVFRTLIADTLFGANANIGGFMTSDEMMVSQTETDGEPNIYMNGKTGEFRCTNAFVRGHIEATSGSIEGELSVGDEFKIVGTSGWQQGIYYNVSDSSENAYGQWKFQPRNLMVVPRNSLLEENDAQVNCLMYLERARNNQLDRVFYAKGISEFNGRVAISSYNAVNTTASHDKPALFVEGGIGLFGGFHCEPVIISKNASVLQNGSFNFLYEITSGQITFDIQSFRDAASAGKMMILVDRRGGAAGRLTISCPTGGFIWADGTRETSVTAPYGFVLLVIKTSDGDVRIVDLANA